MVDVSNMASLDADNDHAFGAKELSELVEGPVIAIAEEIVENPLLDVTGDLTYTLFRPVRGNRPI